MTTIQVFGKEEDARKTLLEYVQRNKATYSQIQQQWSGAGKELSFIVLLEVDKTGQYHYNAGVLVLPPDGFMMACFGSTSSIDQLVGRVKQDLNTVTRQTRGAAVQAIPYTVVEEREWSQGNYRSFTDAERAEFERLFS